MRLRVSAGASCSGNGSWTRRVTAGLLAIATIIFGPAVGVAQSPFSTERSQTGSNTPSGSPLAGEQGQQTRSANTVDPVSEREIEPAAVRDDDEALRDRGNRDSDRTSSRRSEFADDEERQEPSPRLKRPAPPNEFENFVERSVGRRLPRFGVDLLLPGNRDYAVPSVATVPADYILNVGDTVAIAMTGSIEGSVRRQIDTNGRITLPRVGPIRLAGVRNGDLKSTVAAAIGTRFRGFTVTVEVSQLRGVRVYVTGFANNPGAYTVNSLSTLVNAVLAAGGPSAGGSLRSVRLYRNNQLVTELDLYDMLLRGDRSRDAIVQNEDVLFIAPVGPQVAVTGSVNNEAVFELKPGETLEQLLAAAGGPNTVADASRLMLLRQSNYDTIGLREISRATARTELAQGGDIVQVLSQGTLQRSVDRQSVVVRIEGEVNAPGNYYLPANAPLSEALARAGGTTGRAFLYGTRFERVSVRQQQRASYLEAIQQMEISLAAAPISADTSISPEQRAQQVAAARAVLERLRNAEPDGRVVLGLTLGSTALPTDLVLQNNDRIVVPPRPTTLGVFGAVYRPASFLLGQPAQPGQKDRPQRIRDYLERAGGPLRQADRGQIFVVRANGDILTKRKGALNALAQPGDVVFVPIRTEASSLLAKIREITTIIFQLGLPAATLIAVSN